MRFQIKVIFKLNLKLSKHFGAWVICEPWFIGSRDLCELWKYVNHEKISDLCKNDTYLNLQNDTYLLTSFGAVGTKGCQKTFKKY